MLPGTLRFSSYWTIGLGPQQPSFEKFPLWKYIQQAWRQMIADCFSGSCQQKDLPGQEFLVVFTLLIVGSHIPQETKIW